MKTLKVYGSSDDLVETEGIIGCDEFSSFSAGQYHGFLKVTDDIDTIRIHIIYDGSWAFAVSTFDLTGDFEKMPDWPIRRTFGRDCPYSETLEIDVPDNARLSLVKIHSDEAVDAEPEEDVSLYSAIGILREKLVSLMPEIELSNDPEMVLSYATMFLAGIQSSRKFR